MPTRTSSAMPLDKMTFVIPFAVDEAITDTNAHDYNGPGETIGYNVSKFKTITVEIYNTHNQIAPVTLYHFSRTRHITASAAIGDTINVIATSGHEVRTIDLGTYLIEYLRIRVLFASAPTSGNIDIYVYGVLR